MLQEKLTERQRIPCIKKRLDCFFPRSSGLGPEGKLAKHRLHNFYGAAPYSEYTFFTELRTAYNTFLTFFQAQDCNTDCGALERCKARRVSFTTGRCKGVSGHLDATHRAERASHLPPMLVTSPTVYHLLLLARSGRSSTMEVTC